MILCSILSMEAELLALLVNKLAIDIILELILMKNLLISQLSDINNLINNLYCNFNYEQQFLEGNL